MSRPKFETVTFRKNARASPLHPATWYWRGLPGVQAWLSGHGGQPGPLHSTDTSRFGPDSNGADQKLHKTFRAFSDHSLYVNGKLLVQAFIKCYWHIKLTASILSCDASLRLRNDHRVTMRLNVQLMRCVENTSKEWCAEIEFCQAPVTPTFYYFVYFRIYPLSEKCWDNILHIDVRCLCAASQTLQERQLILKASFKNSSQYWNLCNDITCVNGRTEQNVKKSGSIRARIKEIWASVGYR